MMEKIIDVLLTYLIGRGYILKPEVILCDPVPCPPREPPPRNFITSLLGLPFYVIQLTP
jgi:hypothetical protein